MSRIPLVSATLVSVAGGALVLLGSASLAGALAAQDEAPGYDDTPRLPDQEWRVHDRERPEPRVVVPGTASTPDRPGRAPSDAVVLFDGSDLSAWQKQGGGDPGWKVQDGWMEVTATGTIETRQHFGDCQLHVEWASPAEPKGASQGRGNSGVFLMGRYEIQVLDSFENRSYADGQAAAMYGQYSPLVNACREPGAWQSFDIVFHAPRFEGEELVAPARVTVLHNGVLVHHDRVFIGATTHRAVAAYKPQPPTGPIRLQDHGNPVRFRNIWVRPLEAE